MTRMTSLLSRNEQFASNYTPRPLARPAQGLLIVSCLDHRVDPAIVLGVELGDAPVIRNAGGRVTQAVIDEVSYLAFLAAQLFSGGQGDASQGAAGQDAAGQAASGQDAAAQSAAAQSAAAGTPSQLFEVAIIHHTQCGTGFLADATFRQRAAAATGVAEAVLEASAVADPYATVRTDVARLLAAPSIPPGVSVSGHVYDLVTGRVATTLDARFPRLAGTN